MRIRDAAASLQLGREKNAKINPLRTIWSEHADDGIDAVPLSEYPRPQMERENGICLNGWWDYAICSQGSPFMRPDGKILVPFSPETERSGVKRILQPGETLWYIRVIPDLEVVPGKRLILHFGAVDERCIVYWNGRKVGSHRNGYLPFSFDVTDYAVSGDNELKVCVHDDTDKSHACRGKQTLSPGGMYYHAQSGIWQTVWLETVPDIFLKEMRITPDIDKKHIKLQMIFDDHGKNNKIPDETTVRITCEDNIASYKLKQKMNLIIPIRNLRLWNPDDPFLYKLQIDAGEDHVKSYFAMRSFGTGKDDQGRPCLTLNGSPYFFNGILDQGYWPESLMTAPADEAMVYDITEMKRLSFNMIRKHVKTEPERWYYHCDRIGMIVWQDMVNGGGPVNKLLETYLPNIVPAVVDHLRDDHYRLLSRSDKKARKEFEKDLLCMIRSLYNHPCIGLWTPFNEGWGQFDSLRITDLIRSADKTRLIDHASGWFDQGGSDVHSIHNYFRKLEVDYDHRACVLSEYGGSSCNINDHCMSTQVYGYHACTEEEFTDAFYRLMEEIADLRKKGLAGAVYTQLSDIEEETNGLITYDRKMCKIRSV